MPRRLSAATGGADLFGRQIGGVNRLARERVLDCPVAQHREERRLAPDPADEADVDDVADADAVQ